MAIEDRLRKEIVLISPLEDGNLTYFAKWIGDPITKEKKLGRFDAPKVKGTFVQDLEVRGSTHQYTIHFDGEDHDKLASDFWESLDSKGTWEIQHPLLGVFNLYLARAVWEVEPVRSASFTRFTTSWVEGLPDSESVSTPELLSTLSFYNDEANLSVSEAVEENVFLDTFEQFNALVSAANKAVNVIKKNLRKFENLQLINPRLEALFRGISSTLASFPPDLTALTAQFTGLFEAIGLAQNNALGAVDNFITIAQGFTEIPTGTADENGLNAALITELNMSLANTAIAASVSFPGITTRNEAVELATKLNDYFDFMVETLDTIQVQFESSPIQLQYVAGQNSFSAQWKATQQAIRFLLSSALDLKIERRFPIKVPRAPIEIAWTELDGPGEIIEVDGIRIDQNFQNFCEWNDLHDNDILILPAETIVRVFV
jgi:hypothetical protein